MKNEVATTTNVENPLAMFGIQAAELAEVPSFAQADAGAGNENVSSDDQSTVTLSLLQPMSPEVVDNPGTVIPGVWMNSITKEKFTELYVANIFFQRSYPIFYKRNAPKKGLVDSFPTASEANAAYENHPDKQHLEIQETATHYVVVVNAEGIAFPARIFFKSTSLPVSRDWNTQLEAINKGNARFLSLWKLGVTKRSNDKGTWYIPKVEVAGLINDESMYNKIKDVYVGVRETLERLNSPSETPAEQSETSTQ